MSDHARYVISIERAFRFTNNAGLLGGHMVSIYLADLTGWPKKSAKPDLKLWADSEEQAADNLRAWFAADCPMPENGSQS